MKRLIKKMTAVALLGSFFALFPWTGICGQDQPVALGEAARAAGTLQDPGETQEEVIHPGAQNIRERWSIAVFLVWMWVSIAVLLYFIRLLIREADRVHELDLYGLKKPREGGPPSDG